MRRLCRWFTAFFAVLVLIAYGIALVGTQGLFGVQPDGLAAVWLVLVGMPWTAIMTPLLMSGLPLFLGQFIAIAAPLLNIAILVWLCRRAGDA